MSSALPFRPRRLLAAATTAAALAVAPPAVATAEPASDGGPPTPSTGWSRPAAQPATYLVPGDRAFPEGIAAGERGTFFVSSLGDGTVYRGHVDRPELEVFLPPDPSVGRTAVGGITLDRQGRLWLAGGTNGRVWVHDAESGALLADLDNDLPDGSTLLNDLVVTRDAAYLTDSFSPQLWRVPLDREEIGDLEVAVDLAGTPFTYVPGAFNANGIAASRGGRELLVGQSVTGRLFRVDVASGAVDEVDLGGATLRGSDGLLLEGRRLSVVQNDLATGGGLVSVVELTGDLRAGEVTAVLTGALQFPTTAARVDGRLLVVDSQIDALFYGAAVDPPFTVTALDEDVRTGGGRGPAG